jgi:Mrp family chromosome partitioning ATPase
MLQRKDAMNVALPPPGVGGIGLPPGGATRPAAAVRREIAGLMAVVLRLIDQHGSVVLYFTAVSHGEGTSTIARELAVTAARAAWCKVALVDASAASGVENGTPGLLDVPADAADLAFSRAWFGDAELLEAALSASSAVPSVEAVRGLFERLRTQFTLVVVDGPPTAAARHAAAFSAAADYVVLVVEAERTRASDLERARAALEQLGGRMLGIVLNKRRSWVPDRLSRLIWGEAP